MVIIVANLEGEVVEWVMTLHEEEAPELRGPDAFLGKHRVGFSANMQT